MALTYKVVNGVAPNAATETTLYTCPASTKAIVTALHVTRLSSTGIATVTVWVCDGGGATSNARAALLFQIDGYNYITAGPPAAPGSTFATAMSFILPMRLHLAPTDTLVVNFTTAANGSIAFRPTILEVT